MTEKEVVMVYDMILGPEYMNDGVNVKSKISRKAILLLHHVVTTVITTKNSDRSSGLVKYLPEEVFAELKQLSDEWVKEAKLLETAENLGKMQPEK